MYSGTGRRCRQRCAPSGHQLELGQDLDVRQGLLGELGGPFGRGVEARRVVEERALVDRPLLAMADPDADVDPDARAGRAGPEAEDEILAPVLAIDNDVLVPGERVGGV